MFIPFKIGYEFDFVREANAMEKLRRFLYENNKKSPVLVPRLVKNMVTRFVMLLFGMIMVRKCKLMLGLRTN